MGSKFPARGPAPGRFGRRGLEGLTGLPAGYETADEVVGRVVALIEGLAGVRRREVVAVSHGDVVLSAHFWASGIPFSDDTEDRVGLYPAAACGQRR